MPHKPATFFGSRFSTMRICCSFSVSLSGKFNVRCVTSWSACWAFFPFYTPNKIKGRCITSKCFTNLPQNHCFQLLSSKCANLSSKCANLVSLSMVNDVILNICEHWLEKKSNVSMSLWEYVILMYFLTVLLTTTSAH